MTLQDGWHDFAVRVPGPNDRRIYTDNDETVIIGHSLEGLVGSYSTMFDPAKFPTAWHGTVRRTGEARQHYPSYAGLAASNAGNLKGPAWEAEGFAGEPLTDAQVVTFLRIIRDMEAAHGRLYRPGVKREGFTEHNHWGQTACPSGRYQPLYDAIAAGALEDDMADPRVDAILALLTGLGPEAAMAAVNDFNTTNGQPNGNSLLLVVEQERMKLGALIQTVEAHTQAPHAGGLAPGTEFKATVLP